MILPRFTKDPDEVLDYQFDWSDWLATGDTIAGSVMTVDADLTPDSDTNDTTSATVWLSGGTEGTGREVMNQIVTNGGRTANRSILIDVEER